MPKPGLVILDCDGVLVDSERVTTTLLAEVATEVGWPMDGPEAITRFKGRDLHEVQATIETRVGRALGDGFLPGYRERMAARFAEVGVPPIDGAGGLLDWLDAEGIPHAIASNGTHEKMRLTLGGIRHDNGAPGDWFTRFEGRRFSAYEIGRWKPDPELFLYAAREMRAVPETCVVVEDSVSGIEAARAAGMRALAYADLTSAEELAAAGAHRVCGTLLEVRRQLADWLL